LNKSIVSIIVLMLSSASPAFGQERRPHGGMLRFPDVSASQIVFLYANDLWLVPRTGGTAVPLAGPPGAELLPRFSPDGKSIAFIGNYEGNRDLYVIPTDGGVATRVTYHPAIELLCDWSPDGRLVYSTNGFAGLQRQYQLYSTSAAGGLPTKLPVPYGANAAISPDGQWLAYTPHTIDFRTWKRYRGGMATDIWLFNLRTNESKRITDWEGTDTLPMWHGDTVYYLSDAGPEHRLNIWAYDTAGGKRDQLTMNKDWDVKWPAIGPGPDGGGEIVFQYGSQLQLLDLRTRQVRPVDVVIPGDRPRLRPKTVDAEKFIGAWAFSPTGKRALFEARGDIWTAPAKHGSPTRLTRTAGVAERDPLWSPDGKWIAYLSDANGEYELYVTASDGKGEARQLTRDGSMFRYLSSWSPDSKRIAFTDMSGAMYLHTLEGGETKLIDTEPWADTPRTSWSSDSRWIAYTKTGENRQGAIWLYDTAGGETHQVTSGVFNDTWPTFDREGKYLYFASNREFSEPIYEDLGTSWVYAGTDRLFVVPLQQDAKSPLAPKSDEESWDDKDKKKDEAEGEDEGDDDSKGDDDDETGAHERAEEDDNEDNQDADDDEGEEVKDAKKDKKAKDKPKPVEIDIAGFERRAVMLPIEKGSFSNLAVNHKKQLIYTRGPARGTTQKPSIMIFDPRDEKADKKEAKVVVEEAGDFAASADGKMLLVRKDDKNYYAIEAAEKQKLEKPIPLDGLDATVDPRAEWRQIFTDAWRLHRDFFYVPNMHGVDWAGLRAHYEQMLEDCVCRDDVTYVIGEMISELNVGHAYVRGFGDVDPEPAVSVGMLGCDYALDGDAYRITRILEGGAWDADARGPLSQPGVDVKEGDYLLAVNRVPLDVTRDPWAAFQGVVGRSATITVSAKPTLDDEARDLVVDPFADEFNLRYRAWIERNRQLVANKTGDRVGYLHVPDTGINGQNNLVRQFFGQIDKAALIIDERWNGGGQIPTRFIELLNRPITNYWARRHGRDWPWPPDAQQGPKCMLINGLAGSGGDMFPWLFRYNNLGKLIGTRTWGGLVGISGNPEFIDKGNTNVPTFGFYEKDGTWGVEGHGVDPDIEVIDDPAKMMDGGDPQLETAIAHMLDELAKHPYSAPKRPEPPDRRGMGIEVKDQ